MNMVKAHVEYWKMAYLKGVLLFYGGFQMTMSASTANIKWSSLDGFSQIMIIMCAVGGGVTAVVGFLDRTMSRLNEGKDNPAGSDTTMITKT